MGFSSKSYFWNVFVQSSDTCMYYFVIINVGKIVHDAWLKTPELRPNVELDVFVVMPNHIHGIIVITKNDRDVSTTPESKGIFNTPRLFKSQSQTIGAIVRGYKSSVTKKINTLHHCDDFVVWQRNYHEHIIRNERSYQNISNYIINNPEKWNDDKFFT